MWIGVTSGFAMLKFSTSPSKFGKFEVITRNVIEIVTAGVKSLTVKVGWNLILSIFVWMLIWLEDPFSCSNIKCITAIAIITIGSRKCKEKNRFKVGWEIAGPPQIQVVRSLPIIGIADISPVITVAPQKDICPHGSTYPRNAVAIVSNKINIPDNHTFFWFIGDAK